MRFVDYQIVPFHGLEQALLNHTHFVRSNQHVPASVFLANHRLQIDSFFLCAMKSQGAQRRTELLDLVHPVAKRRFGNQNQVGTATVDSFYPQKTWSTNIASKSLKEKSSPTFSPNLSINQTLHVEYPFHLLKCYLIQDGAGVATNSTHRFGSYALFLECTKAGSVDEWDLHLWERKTRPHLHSCHPFYQCSADVFTSFWTLNNYLPRVAAAVRFLLDSIKPLNTGLCFTKKSSNRFCFSCRERVEVTDAHSIKNSRYFLRHYLHRLRFQSQATTLHLSLQACTFEDSDVRSLCISSSNWVSSWTLLWSSWDYSSNQSLL